MELTAETRAEGTAAKISREVVQLLKKKAGRGPTKTRTYLHQECVLVLLREGHTASEQTMHEGGGARSVAQTRVELSESLREPLMEIVERNLGRKVSGFLSSSQQDPDLLDFVFVLQDSPLTSPDDRVDLPGTGSF
ncbi:MAG TPA: Na-translocating system protein MpsC family protein [Solirubrobacterales bacterium]|nr:Na-translocating system protein MpsC family protein [Solirubrobacterales bacterium]